MYVNWKVYCFLLCPSVCFPVLVLSTYKAGKENAVKEDFAISETNLFCPSIPKYSSAEAVTAAACWAVSHLWQPTCPGSKAAACKSGSPRRRVAHLAGQPNNLHILCTLLGSWHASSELRRWTSRNPGWTFTGFQKELCQIELFAWTTRLN